jgi:Transposase DDE domain.
VITAILVKLSGCSKPVIKFISTLFPLWWSISGRYNFTNLARYARYGEQAIRNAFERGFNFFAFNFELVKQHAGSERIIVFDPSYIRKSGKKTYGLGRYWSGAAAQALKGLEMGCLACVDVAAQTALHLEAFQTPAAADRNGKSLVTLYTERIMSRVQSLLTLSRYMVVDGYFMKKEFILPLLGAGMQVITKMRPDANLHYAVRPQDQPKRRGRKKVKGDKINLKKIDKRQWELVTSDQHVSLYTAVVYCVMLKRNVRVIYLLHHHNDQYEVFLCTDTALAAQKVFTYYRLRFQIEFLLRDAKQHSGLEDCQARSKNKLAFHFNMSLSAVSVAKAVYYLSQPQEQRGAFSLQSIKRFYHNKLLSDMIFDNLAIELNSPKIIHHYHQCLCFGSLAA